MNNDQAMNLAAGFSICPACRHQFEDRRVYRIEQVAALLGVQPNTVKAWMRQGKLPFRLWDYGGAYVLRVVVGRDFDVFLESKLGRPGDGSRVAAHWAKIQANGSKGVDARRNRPRVKPNDLTPTDQPPDPSDPNPNRSTT